MNEQAALDRFALYYDLEYGEYDDDLSLYYTYLTAVASQPARVLELGCGSGRLLLALAEAGCAVLGVDASPAMLRRAETKLSRMAGAQFALVAGRMESLALAADYRAELVIVALNTFQYLTSVAQQQACLRAVRPHLAAEGRLILTLPGPANWPDFLGTPGGLLLQGTYADPSTGGYVQKWFSSSFDPASQLEQVSFIYDAVAEDGSLRRLLAPLTLRHSFRYELEHLLTTCGYAVEAIYGDYAGGEFDGGSEHMVFVATATEPG